VGENCNSNDCHFLLAFFLLQCRLIIMQTCYRPRFNAKPKTFLKFLVTLNYKIALQISVTVCTHCFNEHRGSFYVAIPDSNMKRRKSIVRRNVYEPCRFSTNFIYSTFNINAKPVTSKTVAQLRVYIITAANLHNCRLVKPTMNIVV